MCISSFSLPGTSQRVLEVSNHWWYSMLIQPPLLKDSVAAPLLSAYYPDCVGMSPSCTSTNRAAATTTSSASPGKMEPSKAVPSPLGERCSVFPFLTSPSPPWKLKGKQTAENSWMWHDTKHSLLHALGCASQIQPSGVESYLEKGSVCIQLPYYRFYHVCVWSWPWRSEERVSDN